MLLSKNRMRFTNDFQGKTAPEGFVILDLAGLELDGVNKIILSGADLAKLQKEGDSASEKLRKARMLLGGDE